MAKKPRSNQEAPKAKKTNKKKAAEAPKVEKFDTKEGVLNFVDELMDVTPATKKSGREMAREKSKGATGGALKSLDPIIKRITAEQKVDEEKISENKRKIEENYQSIRRQSVSISVIEAKMRDVSHKANMAMGMAEELSKNFEEFKKQINDKLDELENDKQNQSNLWGDILDAAVAGMVRRAIGGRKTAAAPQTPGASKGRDRFGRVGKGLAIAGGAGLGAWALSDAISNPNVDAISTTMDVASTAMDLMPTAKPAAAAASSPGLLSRMSSGVSDAASWVGKKASSAATAVGKTAAAGLDLIDPRISKSISKLGNKTLDRATLAKFMVFAEKKAGGALLKRIGTKIGMIAAGAAVPAAGWIFSLINAGLLIADVIDIADLLLDFFSSSESDEESAGRSVKGPQESAAVKAAAKATAATAGAEAPKTTTPSTTTRKDGQKTDGPGAGGLGGGGGDTIGGGGGFAPADYKQDREFTDELNKLASKYNIDANDLLAVMYSESGLDPQAVNKGSGASGLIQFIPSTAKSLGTSVEDIRKMNRAQQMKYVEAYFASVNLPKNATGGQIYASVFLPAFINKPVLASRGDQYYGANAGLDLDGDGKITMKDLDARVAQMRGKYGLGAGSAKSGVTPGATDEMGRPLPGSTPDAVPTEKGVQPAGTNFSAPNPSAGEARDVSSGYKPTAGTGGTGAGSMPPNVRLGSGINISAVDKDLLSRFFSAAAEYGRPVTIESAARDDKKQAELWVRGNILKEPGIYMPAAPKTAQKVTVNGREYDVPGGGRGSSHSDGQALDVPQAPQMSSILQKYGLTIPFGGSDPVHIQKIGYTPAGGASISPSYSGQTLSRGRMTTAPSASPSPIGMMTRGAMTTMGGGRGSTIPTTIGAAATMPGVGPMMGLLSTLAMGGARTMVPQSPSGIMGLVGSLFNTLNNQNRGNNPQFNIDSLKDNSVPSALPPAEILRDIFGMDVPTTYAP